MRPIIVKVMGVLVGVVLTSWPVQAQRFGGGEYERGLRSGYNVPFDGAPFSHRYNYSTGSFFYPYGDARSFIYQEYLDRLDRAYKFGYRIPTDPFDPAARPPQPSPAHRPRFGLGRFRWR